MSGAATQQSDTAQPETQPSETQPSDVNGLLVSYLLRLGDDALILGQRMTGWYALAPRFEDDVALLNIALDYVGHARVLLTMAGNREGQGRDEDALAFLRPEGQFANAQIMELPNGDFGRTIARLVAVATWHVALYEACADSSDDDLSAFATKASVECRYHVEYAFVWLERLARGTPESARRIQDGIDYVWPFVGELFVGDDVVGPLTAAGLAPDPGVLQRRWRDTVEPVLRRHGLSCPPLTVRSAPGRAGRHLESFTPLIAEMQHLHRAHAGASW